jgi:alpha-L-fucosidase
VIADFYNHTLATRGKVDTFSIVKFHPAANGIVSTVESKYPKDIKRDQDWIGENAAGDWFYKTDIVYSSRALELYLLEEISRDGSYAVNIPIDSDGSIDPGAATMLRAMGAWMRINGEAVYGSHAWTTFGEGPLDANGKQRLLPAGALNRPQADYHFTTADYRFTVGKDGNLYAFVLEKPKPGEHLKIVSLAHPAKPISTVTLLGSGDRVAFQQLADGLEITVPQHLPEQDVLAFKIQ